jgi:uncharacterized protein YecE (DUF72 family)
MAVRVGTSGWVYDHWRGIFYPEELRQANWLGYYAREFDTVEINNTFYRLPSAAAFERWRERVPPGFLYAIKASRFLTHQKKLKEPEEPLRRLIERVNHLGKAAGPLLYQLPPHWRVDLPRLESFLAILPQSYFHVIEFRDQSWLTEDTFRLLERYRVAHCIHDMVPLQVPLRVTASPAYVRLHGDPAHGGDYRLAALQRWARLIDDWQGHGVDVFVYFNNDAAGFALQNAHMLKGLLGA